MLAEWTDMKQSSKMTIITTVIAVLLFIGTISTMYAGFMTRQAEIGIELAHINERLLYISEQVSEGREAERALDIRMTILEQRVGHIQEQAGIECP